MMFVKNTVNTQGEGSQGRSALRQPMLLGLFDSTPHRRTSAGQWMDTGKQAAEKEDNWEENKRGEILRR